MPYAIAHPAAVIPLHRWLGRHSVPSALAIGSVVPDAWYFIPFLDRPDTHTAAGVLLYGLPLALLAYAAFHLLAKAPLLALLPARLAAKLSSFTPGGLPPVSPLAVVVSAAAGALTHVAWDAFTHEGILSWHLLPVLEARLFAIGSYEVRLYQLLQHVSTLLGAAFVAWWVLRKLRQADASPAGEAPQRVAGSLAIGALIAAVPAIVALEWLPALLSAADIGALRQLLRGAAVSSASAFGLAFMAYCLLWHCRTRLAWNR